MKTRMQKYYDEQNNNTLLRQQKNESLYENITDFENLDYKIDNNATVIGENAKDIDVDKIKKILDNKYNQTPKRRSIVIEEEDLEEPNINLDETREYDINAILNQAKSEKEVDYEKERLKKLRDTQYDILNSLELEKEENVPVEKEDTQNELMDLINTITARELITKDKLNLDDKKEINPLDILVDLKGTDDTIIVGGAHEEESVGETSPIMSLEEADRIKPMIMDEKKKLDLTNTLQFTQSDFDDFNDLKKEVKSSKALIYVVIAFVSIILIIGLVIFLNNFLNLNWF